MEGSNSLFDMWTWLKYLTTTKVLTNSGKYNCQICKQKYANGKNRIQLYHMYHEIQRKLFSELHRMKNIVLPRGMGWAAASLIRGHLAGPWQKDGIYQPITYLCIYISIHLSTHPYIHTYVFLNRVSHSKEASHTKVSSHKRDWRLEMQSTRKWGVYINVCKKEWHI